MRDVIPMEEEYRRHPELKRKAVLELAEWIKQHPEYPPTNEHLTSKFLFSCFFDLEKAKKCVDAFYTIRLNNPLFFFERDVLREELQEQLNVVQFGRLPEKDPNGYIVYCHRLQVFDPPRYVFPHSCRLLSMLSEATLRKEGNIEGAVMVFDMRGVSLMHVFRLKISTLKLFFQYVQEGAPARIKAIHVVNTLPIASKIMFLIRPFIKGELMNCIHFHSDNYEEIQKYLPLNCLPSDYGGTQKSIAELHEEFKKWMLELREEFIEDDEEILEFLYKRDELKNKKSNKSSSKSKIEFD